MSQPHDAFFQWVFSRRAHAAGLLKAMLTPEMAEAVDWSRLRVEKGDFVDRALRHRRSDLVLSARMNGVRIFFYALVEQQRDVEALMVFRVGVYMMRLWEQLLREHPGWTKLPPILPIVIHNGPAGWTAATAFQDVVETAGHMQAALLPHVPCFGVRLVELVERKTGLFRETALTALGKVALSCLSAAGDDTRLERELDRVSDALHEVLAAPGAPAALSAVMRYLATTHRDMSPKKIVAILEQAAGPGAREVIVTFLDEIKREGRVEGRVEGRAEALLDLLALRFGPVPPEASARVLSADRETLTRWTARVLTAPSLEKVLAEPRKRATSARKPAKPLV